MSAANFPNLLRPLQVGPLKLRNRFVMAPHGTALAGKDFLPTTEMAAYFAERARGGVAMIVTGGSNVMPNSVSSLFRNVVSDRRAIPGYRRIAEAVHEHGAYVAAQLSHGGRQGRSELNRIPLWSPSPLPDPLYREVPKEMEPEDFETLIKHFILGAQVVQEAGFDGVEVYAAQGYMLSQILSPHTNRRTDQFGGTLDNRIQFILELLARVRGAVGPGFCIGLRMNGDDFTDGGLTFQDQLEVGRAIGASGAVDYLHVSGGTNHSRNLWIADMTYPPGLFVPLAAGIKGVVEIPVIAVNRITSPEQAEAIIAEGKADLIGMVRPLIADAYLPQKTQSGRLDEIRACIGCNQGCEKRSSKGYAVGCIYNPTAGQELELSESTFVQAARARRVLVVGGGPAGMEAARTAARRGHQVALWEKNGCLGGQVPLFAEAVATCAGFMEVVRYLERQIKQLGVEVRLHTPATPEAVLREQADVVILATGSRPSRTGYTPALPAVDRLPGCEQENVLTAWDVLSGTKAAGRRVVIYDEQSSLYTAVVAEFLGQAGHDITIVTRLAQFGLEIPQPNYGPQMKRLVQLGVHIRPHTLITGIMGQTLHLANVFSRAAETMAPVDTVVLTLYHEAENDLYKALKGQVAELHAVGDCVAPRGIQLAVENAHRLARAI